MTPFVVASDASSSNGHSAATNGAPANGDAAPSNGSAHPPARDEPSAIVLDSLAHDLRRYITPILGFAEIMSRTAASLTPAQCTEYSNVIMTNARSMNNVLIEMLDLQRFDAGAWVIYRRPTDVVQLIESLVVAMRVSDRKVSVTGGGPMVDVDPGLLERIVENLITNARVHTPPGTPIYVTASTDEAGALVVVTDEGPGVPDGLKGGIFEAFRRESVSTEGSGIGLTLVARFAGVHGGRAWVEDAPHGGAAFHVFLPASASAVADGGPATTVPTA